METKKEEVKKMTLKDFENVIQISNPNDWSLDYSMKCDGFSNGALDIKDKEERADYLRKAGNAFKRAHGLDANDSAINILMIAGGLDGCGFVRVDNPAKYINREDNIVAFPTLKVLPELLDWAHVIVWQRQYKKSLVPLRELMKKLGKIQVFEIDDNLHKVPTWNPAYESYNPSTDAYREMLEWIKECDILTTTKDSLGQFYKELTGIDYHVLPNCIDFEKFPNSKCKENTDGVIRIGWAGSFTHFRDLEKASYGLNHIKDKYGDKVQFVIMGWDGLSRRYEKVDETKELDSHNAKLVIDKDSLDGLDREFHKFVDPKNYYKAIEKLNLDIAITPVDNNDFNNTGKSNIKWLEFSAAKIPVVASKTPVYEAIEHGVTGFLCKRESDWVKNLEKLIDSQELRHEIANNAYKKVRKDFNISTKASEWVNLYRSLFIKNINNRMIK